MFPGLEPEQWDAILGGAYVRAVLTQRSSCGLEYTALAGIAAKAVKVETNKN